MIQELLTIFEVAFYSVCVVVACRPLYMGFSKWTRVTLVNPGFCSAFGSWASFIFTTTCFNHLLHLWLIVDSRMNNPSEATKSSMESGDGSTGKEAFSLHPLHCSPRANTRDCTLTCHTLDRDRDMCVLACPVGLSTCRDWDSVCLTSSNSSEECFTYLIPSIRNYRVVMGQVNLGLNYGFAT